MYPWQVSTVIKPPQPLPPTFSSPSVFLAGSIDMGTSIEWQKEVEKNLEGLDIVILNPRRDEWDSSWKQSIENDQFREQVEWELDGLERASMIAVYFAPYSKAPITLLELGMFVRSGKVMVCCPEGYWRRGNVEVVCKRFNVPMVATLAGLTDSIRQTAETSST